MSEEQARQQGRNAPGEERNPRRWVDGRAPQVPTMISWNLRAEFGTDVDRSPYFSPLTGLLPAAPGMIHRLNHPTFAGSDYSLPTECVNLSHNQAPRLPFSTMRSNTNAAEGESDGSTGFGAIAPPSGAYGGPYASLQPQPNITGPFDQRINWDPRIGGNTEIPLPMTSLQPVALPAAVQSPYSHSATEAETTESARLDWENRYQVTRPPHAPAGSTRGGRASRVPSDDVSRKAPLPLKRDSPMEPASSSNFTKIARVGQKKQPPRRRIAPKQAVPQPGNIATPASTLKINNQLPLKRSLRSKRRRMTSTDKGNPNYKELDTEGSSDTGGSVYEASSPVVAGNIDAEGETDEEVIPTMASAPRSVLVPVNSSSLRSASTSSNPAPAAPSNATATTPSNATAAAPSNPKPPRRRPRHNYITPIELESTEKALSPDTWDEFLWLIEKSALMEISSDVFDAESKKLFETDNATRMRIKKLVLKKMIGPTLWEKGVRSGLGG